MGFFVGFPLDSGTGYALKAGMPFFSFLSPPSSPVLGLVQSFFSSSAVGQLVVVVLFITSVMAWTAMVVKGRMFLRVRQQNASFIRAFRRESHPFSLFLRAERFPDCPVYRIYLRSCEAAARLLGMEDMDIGELLQGHQRGEQGLTSAQLQVIRESAERELADRILHLERDLSVLATTTTVAPFMGLLGTVWGVMEAFNGMAATASPTSSAVISGISAALLTTVVGLLVAIPTVVGYNFLSVRLRNETVGMDNFVQELAGEFHFAYVKEV